MIIATICLLVIVAWLFFNALNEKRWVDTHRHDETVSADDGLLPSYSAITTALTGHTGELPKSDNKPLARTMTGAKKTGSELYKRVEHRLQDGAEAVRRSATEDDGALHRLTAKTGDTISTVGRKIEQKVGEAKTFVSASAKSHRGGDGAIAKATSAVKKQLRGVVPAAEKSATASSGSKHHGAGQRPPPTRKSGR